MVWSKEDDKDEIEIAGMFWVIWSKDRKTHLFLVAKNR